MAANNTPAISNQQKIETLAQALKRAAPALSAVAAKLVTPDRLIKIAIAAAQRSPDLLECTPASIVRSVIQGAELGLAPGSALNHCYLVPFNNKRGGKDAQLIVSAQGYAELAYRSGLVSFIDIEVVYDCDFFEYEKGLEPKLRHIPSGETSDPKRITHAYMVVGLKDGARPFRVMTRAEIDRIRDRAPGGGKAGPWVTDYAEMARKTVAKNGFKYVPKSIEVGKVAALENAQDSGDYTIIDFDTPEAVQGYEPEAKATAVESLSNKIAAGLDAPDVIEAESVVGEPTGDGLFPKTDDGE